MDMLDHKILEFLDADARRSYAEMARELGISQPTVADRIRRLEERGIVRGAMLRIDHARLGFAVSAFVRLRSKSAHKPKLIEVARAIPQVIEMHSVTGEDCLIARVCARSVEELAEILQRLTSMAESSTSVVLETHIPLRNPMLARPAPPARVVRRNGNGVAVVRAAPKQNRESGEAPY